MNNAILKENSPPLAAESLAADPRVAQARQLLLDAVKSHQSRITGVRPPNPALKANYEKLLSTLAENRGGKLWFPYLGSGLGKGALVELLDGSVKYDFICGIGPHYFGHSHPDLVASSIDAAISDTIMQGHLQQNKDAAELIELLVKSSKLDHCFLTTTGAMANENALKIIFQKKFPATRILAFEHCFAGRTLASAQITDKPSFREGLPSNLMVDYIPFYDVDRPEESTREAVKALKKLLARYPKEYALMLVELVQGEGGFYYGTKEFFTAILSILRENNVAILMDEVQTFGRLPQLFAFQYFGLEKFTDIATIGKLSQVCATLYTKEFKPRPGLLSQTFLGSTTAIRGSTVIIKELLEGGYFGPNGKINQIHEHFVKNLKALAKQYPKIIKGPYGIGCMIAFTPFDGDSQRANQLVHDLFEAGLMSFVAGSDPTRIRLLVPAGAVTFEDIDNATRIIEQTMTKR